MFVLWLMAGCSGDPGQPGGGEQDTGSIQDTAPGDLADEPSGDAQLEDASAEDVLSEEVSVEDAQSGDVVLDSGAGDTALDAGEDDAASDATADSGVDASPDTALDTGPPPRTPKSLVIALDGVRPDALAYAPTPRIDALIQGTWQPGYRGAYAPDAQNLYDATTVSGPNHTAIMTGANGGQDGVTGNGDVAGGNFSTYPCLLYTSPSPRD